MFTHSFVGTRPPARFDGVPWTRILVEESADRVVASQIDDQAIAIDPTPASPDPVDFTVATATLERGWFRTRFKDAAGNVSQYTDWVFSPSTSSLSIEELKRRLDLTTDGKDDLVAEDLASAVAQAQAPWPNGCGRLLIPDPISATDPPVQRRVRTRGRRIAVADAREITEVLVDDVATSAYETLTKNGLIIQIALDDDGLWTDNADFTPVPRQRVVKITGRFGFMTIPDPLAGAIYSLAARYYYERAAQYADQVEILEGTAVQAYYRQLPPRVKLVFASFAAPKAIGGLR